METFEGRGVVEPGGCGDVKKPTSRLGTQHADAHRAAHSIDALLHLDGLGRAGIDTGAAVGAQFAVNNRLAILYFDRAAGARLDAVATTFALLELDNRSHYR